MREISTQKITFKILYIIFLYINPFLVFITGASEVFSISFQKTKMYWEEIKWIVIFVSNMFIGLLFYIAYLKTVLRAHTKTSIERKK